MPTVARHIALNLDHIGRYGASSSETPLSEVPAPHREMKERSFTVKSARLDAVAAGMFNISRTRAAELITQGLVQLNYRECLRTDAPVAEGDVLSARGFGKGSVKNVGGTSRKGRIFVLAEIYQ